MPGNEGVELQEEEMETPVEGPVIHGIWFQPSISQNGMNLSGHISARLRVSRKMQIGATYASQNKVFAVTKGRERGKHTEQSLFTWTRQ